MMKKLLALVMVLSLLFCCLNAAYGGDAEPAPDFEMKDADGNTVMLSSHFGKPILLNFWATWCVPCVDELPEIDRVYREYGDRIDVITVNVLGYGTDEAYVAEFMRDHGFAYPVYYEVNYSGEIAYYVNSIPRTVLISGDGTLLETLYGTMSSDTVNRCIGLLLGQRDGE